MSLHNVYVSLEFLFLISRAGRETLHHELHVWVEVSKENDKDCHTSMVSGLRLRIYNSWLPMHKVKILLLIRKRGAKNTKFGAYIQRIVKSAPEF